MWSVVFYETIRGEEVVAAFMSRLQATTQAKLARYFDLLTERGPILPMPYARPLTGPIWELRIRGSQEIRILYAHRKRTIYVLHGFIKQTQTTPKRHIELAAKRWNELTNL